MSTFTPLNARPSRIGLAFAALMLITAVGTPALAAPEEPFEQRYHKRYQYQNDYPNYRSNNYRDDNYRHRHSRRYKDSDGFFSFGFGGPVYSDPPYYYAPAPQYYYPPPPRYYQPGPSFNLTIPLGD